MEHTKHAGLSEVARDHAAHPRNHGPLKGFNGRARITGPCGDTMEFWLIIKDEKIERISFITDGCGSSLACGSMTTCLAKSKRIEEAAALESKAVLDALGGLSSKFEHCALLAVNTLKAACEDYTKRRKESKETSYING